MVDASAQKPVTFKCADGADATTWAATAAQIVRADGSSPAPVVQQFIFEAEGQLWVPVNWEQACAMGSPLPSSLRKLGCEPVLACWA